MSRAALQNSRGQSVGNAHHNRGLKRFDAALVSGGLISLSGEIERRLGKARKVRLLEIGCGEGRMLLDLLARFGDAIELHGVNAQDWPVIAHDRDLRDTNARYGVMSAHALDQAAFPPRIHLADAQNLALFPARHFDLVVSQVSVPHITRKDRVLEASARVLRKGGLFVHEIDQLNKDVVEVSGPDLPRFVVLKGTRPRSTATLLRKHGVRIHRCNPDGTLECVFATYVKHGASLRLGLEFDPEHSIILKGLPRRSGEGALWGVRSVFRITEP